MAGVPAEHRSTPEHRRDLAEQRGTLYPRDQQIRPWSGTYPCSPCGGNGQRHGAARPQADTFGVTQQSDRDNAGPLRRICQYAFPHASRVIDRFHVQKLALEAVQEIRIKHRWEAIDADTEAREQAKLGGRAYVPKRLENGDTLKELLVRGRYALFKSPEKWTPQQHQRAEMMFALYPDLRDAYRLSQHLRAIFNKRSVKSAARLNLARWYNQVADAGFRPFNSIAATVYEHHEEILNYFDNLSTNASAESINSKIKAFRAKLHGVTDKKFFIFRICNLYA